MKKKIMAAILAMAIMIPPVIMSAAANPLAAIGGAVAAKNVISVGGYAVLAEEVASRISTALSLDEGQEGIRTEAVLEVLDRMVDIMGYGDVGWQQLNQICSTMNVISQSGTAYFDVLYREAAAAGLDVDSLPVEAFRRILYQLLSFDMDVSKWKIIQDMDGRYVIVNDSETFTLCNSLGYFPYAEEADDLWLPYDEVVRNRLIHEATELQLDEFVRQQEDWNPSIKIYKYNKQLADGRYTVLQTLVDGVWCVLCDSSGKPYGYPLDDRQLDSGRDYNNDVDGQPEASGDTIYDVDGNFVYQMLPDGTVLWNPTVIYDAGDQSYNITSNSTYNTENNTYISYEWNYTFYIDYTSITYIGATEEYTELYEYYYDLPDGRSSADLTAEELLVLNTAVDVVPYIRSADSTALRSLYHFDGDTRDASYWSHLTQFDWASGASLTYMEAGAFGGALYLDELEHEFSFTLPSYVGISDFTFQWRFYHSHTLTPVFDSGVYVGDTQLLSFSGAAWSLEGSGQTAASGPGSWHEVALIRHDQVLYLYLDGLAVASCASVDNLNDVLRFSFGGEQQTYKYVDEFRALNYALVESGEDYTPTSVPHDTNLTLVLPDSTIPVADEYWVFDSTGNLFPTFDFTDPNATVTGLLSSGEMYYVNFGYNNVDGVWSVRSDYDYVTAGYADGAWRFSHLASYTRPTYSTSTSFDSVVDAHGWHFAIACYDASDKEFKARLPLVAGGSYTFSVMLRDGSVFSVPFTLPTTGTTTSSFKPSNLHTYVDLPDGSSIAYQQHRYDTDTSCWLTIYPPSGGSVDIVYVELVEGAEPNTGHELVSAIAPVSADFKTPTLAVRTDLDITGYQLGGVRPSLPSKGLVWGLVEGGRIRSLQIYNGAAWEEVDARIWTGERWVPYYAYDVVLLKDLYDVVGSDPTMSPIYTETGFWTWLQDAWAQMLDKLDAIINGLGGSSGTDPDQVQLPGIEDDPTTDEDDGWVFVDLIVIVRDGVWRIVTGVVDTGLDGLSGLADGVGYIGDYFTVFDPASSGGLLGLDAEGDAVWD